MREDWRRENMRVDEMREEGRLGGERRAENEIEKVGLESGKEKRKTN